MSANIQRNHHLENCSFVFIDRKIAEFYCFPPIFSLLKSGNQPFHRVSPSFSWTTTSYSINRASSIEFNNKFSVVVNLFKIVFCKSSKNSSIKNATLKVGDYLIKQKDSVKYFGVYLDRNLNYQAEVKNILRKMACSIKTIYYVRDFPPEKTRLFLLNALVISHLQYSSVLLNGISQSLISTLEKQLNWGVKACFNRCKMDSAQDLRIKHGIISVRKTLDMNAIKLFWKWKHNLPAFSSLI